MARENAIAEILRKYFDDFGTDTDKEEWVNANLQNTSEHVFNVD